jgi:hypothetical protein
VRGSTWRGRRRREIDVRHPWLCRAFGLGEAKVRRTDGSPPLGQFSQYRRYQTKEYLEASVYPGLEGVIPIQEMRICDLNLSTLGSWFAAPDVDS